MNYNTESCISKCHNQINIINTFRKLWEQHIMWTRSFIISNAEELGDLDYVTTRLLRNPTDFAIVLRNYYGIQKAKRFEELLSEHLLLAASLMNNAKAGNTEAVNEDRRKWYENADNISIFLSEINPYWSRRQFQVLLYEHLRMVEEEAVLRLNKKYEEDIALYRPMENEALKIADLMAHGILKQFFQDLETRHYID